MHETRRQMQIDRQAGIDRIHCKPATCGDDFSGQGSIHRLVTQQGRLLLQLVQDPLQLTTLLLTQH